MKTAAEKKVDPTKLQNEEALACPQPGDYWCERVFVPVLLVMNADDTLVTVCDKFIPLAGGKGKTWDLDRCCQMTYAAFKEKLSYGAIPGTWANVTSGKFRETIALWMERGKPIEKDPPVASPDEKLVAQLGTELRAWGCKHQVHLLAPQWRDLSQRMLKIVKDHQR